MFLLGTKLLFIKMHHEEVCCLSDESVCDWLLSNMNGIRINDKKAFRGG